MNIPIKFNKILKSGQLSQLLVQADMLAMLNGHLKHLLETPLNDHCQVLALRGQTLILAADSPVWAARLRFHIPRLVKQFSRLQTVPLSTIRVKVCPISRPTAPANRPAPKRRGAAGKRALLQAAETVSDPELKSALQKLAGHYPSR
jgi:hypothetical protein